MVECLIVTQRVEVRILVSEPFPRVWLATPQKKIVALVPGWWNFVDTAALEAVARKGMSVQVRPPVPTGRC